MDAIIYKYKCIKLKDGTTRDEHRLVMEKYLGRKLTRFEIVHHKNENKMDNDLENLEVQTLSDHSRMHMKGNILSDIIKIKISNALKGRPNIYGRKLNPAQVRELKEMRAKNVSLNTIASIFGIDRKSAYLIIKGKTYTDIV